MRVDPHSTIKTPMAQKYHVNEHEKIGVFRLSKWKGGTPQVLSYSHLSPSTFSRSGGSFPRLSYLGKGFQSCYQACTHGGHVCTC